MPVVETLLNRGADVTISSPGDGGTALHFAAAGGYDEIAVALLNKGADKDERCQNGRTPLMEAARKGHLRIVETLPNVDADVGLVGGTEGLALRDREDDYTALHFATHERHLGVVTAFLSKGADKESRDYCDRTPLMTAAGYDHLPIVCCLLAEGVDKDAVDEDGQTALDLATFEEFLSVAEALLAAGADPNIRSSMDHDTPLELAIRGNSIGFVKALLDHGADVNARDPRGRTPLHEACSWRASDAVLRLLLLSGADDTALDEQGDAPGARKLLAGRAWRRRGWLVISRSRKIAHLKAERREAERTLDKDAADRGGGDEESPPVQRQARKTRGGGSDEHLGVVDLAAKLFEAPEGVFRNVVSFL